MPISNDPSRTMEEKIIYNKMKDTFEGSIDTKIPDPNAVKPAYQFTIYDKPAQQASTRKKPQDFNYRDYIAPRIPTIGNAPPQYFPQYYPNALGGPLAEFESPPVINQYLISAGGPREAAFISNIYEDVMPTSVLDLNNVSSVAARKINNEYIKISLFPQGGGKPISFDTNDKNCLLSLTKLIKLAPYAYEMVNPYSTLPRDTLIYHSVYPIIKDGLDIKIPKDCTMLNIIIYKLLDLNNYGDKIKGELEYYMKIGRIVKNRICPNFVTMYDYYKNEKCQIDFDGIRTNKLNITNILTNGQESMSLVLLTEGPTCSLQQWRTKKFIIDGNARKTSSTGYKTEDVWKSVLFQFIAGIYTMQKNKIYIHNFGVDNMYIKELQYSNRSEMWKYNVDGFEYYVPNMGFLALIDLNRSNGGLEQKIYINRIIEGKNEIKSDKCNTDEEEKLIKCACHKMLLDVLEQIIEPNDEKRIRIMPDDIKDLINKIITHLRNTTKPDNISDVLYDFFGDYLNNRIGTLLTEQEIKYADNKSGINFERGSVCVMKENNDVHRFVLYVGDTDKIGSKSIIITNKNNNPEEPRELINKEINKTDLYKYLGQIQQKDKVTLNGIYTYNNIIDTYKIEEIV
jgi:hypothetical protein